MSDQINSSSVVNEKLIQDTDFDLIYYLQANEELNSRKQAKLDAAKIAKSDNKYKSLINKIRNKLSILKPVFPLHYIHGKKTFINHKIFGFSLAVLVLIGYLSYGYIDEIGKITLVQKYLQKWKSLEDLNEQFSEAKPKHLDADIISENEHLKNLLNIKPDD